MKKITLLAFAVALTVVSCKKEDASSRIQDENVKTAEAPNGQTENTPVADPNAANTPSTDATVSQDGAPVATFDKTVHDFGNLKKGTKGETEFTVKNTGNVDLVIIDAKASCGCTVPEYPKTPIKPGQSEKIKVVFSANSPGTQSKTVTLTTNTQAKQELLTIKANVSE